MPQILINKNGIDLEEIERMQNEKDEVCLKSQRKISITRKELAENIYSSKEACEYLGITNQRLSVLAKQNRVPRLKNTKHMSLFLFNDLYEYKATRRQYSKNLKTGKQVISVSESDLKEIIRTESGEQSKDERNKKTS